MRLAGRGPAFLENTAPHGIATVGQPFPLLGIVGDENDRKAVGLVFFQERLEVFAYIWTLVLQFYE